MSERRASVAIGPLAGLRVIEVGGKHGQWAGKLPRAPGCCLSSGRTAVAVRTLIDAADSLIERFVGDATQGSLDVSGLSLRRYHQEGGVPG